jgi:hypothetical protein
MPYSEELKEALDGIDNAEDYESEVAALRLALDLALEQLNQIITDQN